MSENNHIRPEYLTIKQLKSYSGLGQRFIRDALKDPKHPLPCYRLNQKTVLIRTGDFNDWIGVFRVDLGSQVDEVVEEVLQAVKEKEAE